MRTLWVLFLVQLDNIGYQAGRSAEKALTEPSRLEFPNGKSK